MKIAVIAAYAPSLRLFRGDLLREMRRRGHEVLAMAPEPDLATRDYLARIGIELVEIPFQRTGMNPLGDLAAYRELVRILRRAHPEVVLTYTIKPNIWGSLAARRARVPHIYPMVTGLGYAFMENNDLRGRIAGAAARFLYWLAGRHAATVFFQNPDDEQVFRRLRLLSRRTPSVVLAGSGVNVDDFAFDPVSSAPPVRFLLIGRLLADKGIREYVQAARRLLTKPPIAEFHLVGPTDPNPSAISPSETDEWVRQGVIHYHGSQDDVRPLLRHCHVYVLPSYYREGTPRTVLEAMSIGRAVITTDMPGCRETVRPMNQALRDEVGPWLDADAHSGAGWLPLGRSKVGGNGILIPVRDVDSLEQAMRMFTVHGESIPIMGRESRRYVEDRYDVNKVNTVILNAMGLAP